MDYEKFEKRYKKIMKEQTEYEIKQHLKFMKKVFTEWLMTKCNCDNPKIGYINYDPGDDSVGIPPHGSEIMCMKCKAEEMDIEFIEPYTNQLFRLAFEIEDWSTEFELKDD